MDYKRTPCAGGENRAIEETRFGASYAKCPGEPRHDDAELLWGRISRILPNTLGYTLLGEGKLDAAVGILRLNTEFFPGSANAYDSLAESYLKRGDKELAIIHYEKSLQLNPENLNALEKLRTQGELRMLRISSSRINPAEPEPRSCCPRPMRPAPTRAAGPNPPGRCSCIP